MPLMRACEPLQGLLQLKPLVFGSAKSQKGKSQPYAPGLWMEFSLDRLIQNSGELLCIYSLDKRCDSCNLFRCTWGTFGHKRDVSGTFPLTGPVIILLRSTRPSHPSQK